MAEETKHTGSGISYLLRQKVWEPLSNLPFSQEIERKVEDGINRALNLLDIPSREEMEDLQERIDRLLNRCESLMKQKSEPKVAEVKAEAQAEVDDDPFQTPYESSSEDFPSEEDLNLGEDPDEGFLDEEPL
jgi:BMFP domain-containing protein YqiC